jgi:hypothetical protein
MHLPLREVEFLWGEELRKDYVTQGGADGCTVLHEERGALAHLRGREEEEEERKKREE